MANPLHDALFAPHEGSERAFLRLPDGAAISFGAFLDRSARFAGALREAGLEPGDRLAAQVPKSPDALALYAACIRAGVAFLPLNTAYTPGEVDYFLGDSEAGLLLCDEASEAALAPVAKARGARLATLGADGGGGFARAAEAMPAGFEPAARGPDDLAALLYTSGTTGRSKGAMLTHRNLLSNARVLADLWEFTEEDVLLHALPIFHTHGLFVATNVALLAGSSLVFLPGFDLDRVIEWLPRATSMMGVPTFYTRLLGDERLAPDLVRGARLFVSGSAPLLAETHRAFEARTGHRILERYGMTETSMICSNPVRGERRAGTVGPPLPGIEVRIRGEDGEDVPAGETGMLEVRGPNVFAGYWRMPEKTAEEMRPDGFFATGDLARRDADGYVAIVGREKDLVISGGYNVYPAEVERALDAQDGVLESAVVGAPHPDLGEGAVAVLVPRPGAEIDLAAVEAGIGGLLARFKQPRRYEVVPELPRNSMGKVQKNVLRERYAGAFRGA